RQSCFALLGDLAVGCFEHIRPYVPELLPRLTEEIDVNFQFVSVCNNAAWAAGEIALKYGAETRPYVQPMLERLVPLLVYNEAHGITGKAGGSRADADDDDERGRKESGVPPMLAENCAITTGRLGLVCTNLVAPHLESFVASWCVAFAH
ncbi:MAG: armadillo-type protein, partial [Olpidium bornovanus]